MVEVFFRIERASISITWNRGKCGDIHPKFFKRTWLREQGTRPKLVCCEAWWLRSNKFIFKYRRSLKTVCDICRLHTGRLYHIVLPIRMYTIYTYTYSYTYTYTYISIPIQSASLANRSSSLANPSASLQVCSLHLSHTALKMTKRKFDRSVCTACKSSLLNICAVKEQLIFNIVVCLRESVVLFVIHLLRSESKELKQGPLIDRWPLILFEKLWKPSTAFIAYVRKI